MSWYGKVGLRKPSADTRFATGGYSNAPFKVTLTRCMYDDIARVIKT